MNFIKRLLTYIIFAVCGVGVCSAHGDPTPTLIIYYGYFVTSLIAIELVVYLFYKKTNYIKLIGSILLINLEPLLLLTVQIALLYLMGYINYALYLSPIIFLVVIWYYNRILMLFSKKNNIPTRIIFVVHIVALIVFALIMRIDNYLVDGLVTKSIYDLIR